MTDHYNTLGIPRDASPDQIRRAYKSKASAAHPDREGGSDKAMAAINAARDCLMDELRRLQYDATGEDGHASSVEKEGEAALASMFDEAIENGTPDLVRYVRDKLANAEASLTSGIQAAKQRVRVLTKRRDRVKAKGAHNIVHVLIDRKIQAAERDAAGMARGVEVMRAARALAVDYENVPEPPRPESTADAVAAMMAQTQRRQMFFGMDLGAFGSHGDIWK